MRCMCTSAIALPAPACRLPMCAVRRGRSRKAASRGMRNWPPSACPCPCVLLGGQGATSSRRLYASSNDRVMTTRASVSCAKLEAALPAWAPRHFSCFWCGIAVYKAAGYQLVSGYMDATGRFFLPIHVMACSAACKQQVGTRWLIAAAPEGEEVRGRVVQVWCDSTRQSTHDGTGAVRPRPPCTHTCITYASMNHMQAENAALGSCECALRQGQFKLQ